MFNPAALAHKKPDPKSDLRGALTAFSSNQPGNNGRSACGSLPVLTTPLTNRNAIEADTSQLHLIFRGGSLALVSGCEGVSKCETPKNAALTPPIAHHPAAPTQTDTLRPKRRKACRVVTLLWPYRRESSRRSARFAGPSRSSSASRRR
jgi:hypothetical protein